VEIDKVMRKTILTVLLRHGVHWPVLYPNCGPNLNSNLNHNPNPNYLIVIREFLAKNSRLPVLVYIVQFSRNI